MVKNNINLQCLYDIKNIYNLHYKIIFLILILKLNNLNVLHINK